jgi:hypothetical protein
MRNIEKSLKDMNEIDLLIGYKQNDLKFMKKVVLILKNYVEILITVMLS